MSNSDSTSILDRKLSNRVLLWLILLCLIVVVVMRIPTVTPEWYAEKMKIKMSLDNGLREQVEIGNRDALRALIVITEIPDFRIHALRSIEISVPESAWEDRSPLAARDWLKANIDQLVFDPDTKTFCTASTLETLRSIRTTSSTRPADESAPTSAAASEH